MYGTQFLTNYLSTLVTHFYSYTSALIVLWHNDRGVVPLIVKGKIGLISREPVLSTFSVRFYSEVNGQTSPGLP